ncbi:uncharacterized protein LOC117652664 [Thrips palmi]|uniref:Uncharacterized protein LOC117652664 n=1 Tax=Thrips palmi TaxID=161013 RepID=A0A6P9A6U4_THRPL|nr:uncharacterized protein LOC117652664 [Thrips palmi]
MRQLFGSSFDSAEELIEAAVPPPSPLLTHEEEEWVMAELFSPHTLDASHDSELNELEQERVSESAPRRVSAFLRLGPRQTYPGEEEEVEIAHGPEEEAEVPEVQVLLPPVAAPEVADALVPEVNLPPVAAPQTKKTMSRSMGQTNHRDSLFAMVRRS